MADVRKLPTSALGDAIISAAAYLESPEIQGRHEAYESTVVIRGLWQTYHVLPGPGADTRPGA